LKEKGIEGIRMSDLLVSVVIPSYNRAHCIAGAIRSALAQDWRELEVIIADDGSADDTESAVLALNEPSVRYVRKVNGGCSSARNFGVRHARGKYVAFLDSDDTWEPAWITTAIERMERDPGIGAVYSSLELIDNTGKATGIMDLTLGGRHEEATVPYVLARCMGLLGSNVIARREVVNAIGGWDESFPTSGDLDFGLRLAQATRVALVAKPFVKLVETAGSLSKKVNSGNRLRVLAKFADAHPESAQQHARILRASRARIYRSYAEDLLWYGRTRDAEQQLQASLRTAFSLRACWLLMKAQIIKLPGFRRTPSVP
jgi:glycosyltransferase involved in cell wall biosynthesis